MSELLAWGDALKRVLAAAEPLSTESIDTTAAACGRVLAVSLQASWDLPQAAVSTMDGYAVRAADLVGADDVALAIAGESAAGRPASAPRSPRRSTAPRSTPSCPSARRAWPKW